MSFDYKNLDQETRNEMGVEISNDINNNQLYLSDRLSPKGIADYPELLKQATYHYDALWLAKQLVQETRLLPMVNTARGPKKVPSNAATTLAEGEFNRYYMRGLCRIAIINNVNVEVYRAKSVDNARILSQHKVGQVIDPKILLNDLRENIGVDTALGLPSGPNSGLSIKLIDN